MNPTPAGSFGHTLLGNMGWQALAVLTRLLISMGALAILARLAGPEVMGLYGLTWVAVALGFAFAQSGAAKSIIVLPDVRPGHFAAGFAMAMGISVLLGLTMALGSPVIENIYGKPGVAGAYVTGAAFVPLMAMGTVDIALAQKALDFRSIARVQVISSVLSATSAIALALIWDPLVGLFALQGLSGLFQFALFRTRGQAWPTLRFSRSDLRDLWQVGFHLSLNSLTAVLLRNSPQLIIARFLPLEAVGLFTLSQRVIEVIGNQFGGVVNQVIYPTFAAINTDQNRVGAAFLLTSRYTAFGMMLPLLVLAVAPSDFLTLFAGPKWSGGGAVLLILVLMQTGLALGQNIFPTFQAIGLPAVPWQWNLIFISLQATLIVSLGTDSAEAAAGAMAATTAIMPFAAWWLARKIRFSLIAWATNMAQVIIPAIAIGSAVHFGATYGASALTPLSRLFLASTVALAAYLSVIVVTDARARQLLLRYSVRGRP